MTDETNEDRYVIDVSSEHVEIVDTESGHIVETFTSSRRLLLAEQYAAEMNRKHEMGVRVPAPKFLHLQKQAAGIRPLKTQDSPSEFLKVTLPAYAKAQRADALLADLDRVERTALDMIREGGKLLERVGEIREHLSGPLSGSVAAQNASGVGQDTPDVWKALDRAWEPIERDLFIRPAGDI